MIAAMSISRRASPDPNALFDKDGSDEGPAATPVPLAAPLTFDAKLVIEKGAHAGRVLKLGGGTATLGRSSKCELSLKGSTGVSRRHCKIQLVGDRYAVIDLESRNGTVVNGSVLDRKILVDGDLIEVGDEHIRFVSVSKIPAQAPAVSELPDINDRDTALLDAVHAAALLSPAKAAPERNEKSSASKTAPKQSAPPRPAARAPPLPKAAKTTAPKTAPTPATTMRPDREPAAVTTPQLPDRARTDATQSFFYDPDVVAQAEESDPHGTAPPPLPSQSAPPRARASLPSALAERSTMREAPRSGGGAVIVVLVVLAVVVVGALGAAAYDTLLGEQRLLALLHKKSTLSDLVKNAIDGDQVVLDKRPLVNDKQPSYDPPKDDLPRGDEGRRDLAAAPPVQPPRPVDDHGLDAKGGDAKAGDAKVGDDSGAARGVDVVAVSGGRVASVRVKAGANIDKGAVLLVLEGNVPTRKLNALREVEAELAAAAAKGNATAKRDLDKARAEIAELNRGSAGARLTSDRAGRVLEVLVKAGDVVKSGQAIARVASDQRDSDQRP